uniref:Uncharacterized protein n=1 Tax=Anguilla anguilla TaxID=7936 RepID=A0A0E9UHD2_ANGAN
MKRQCLLQISCKIIHKNQPQYYNYSMIFLSSVKMCRVWLF